MSVKNGKNDLVWTDRAIHLILWGSGQCISSRLRLNPPSGASIVILDRLENAVMHRAASAEIALGLDYLRRTDFSQVSSGRYDLDGDRVYALVQRYRTKPLAEAKWEAHQRYLDIQYIAEGTECMGHALLHNGLTVQQSYDAEKDFALYEADGDFFTLQAGSFAIFAPQDVHAPGLAADGPASSADVCKVVIKCRLP